MMATSAYSSSDFMSSQLASCLANGLGSLCSGSNRPRSSMGSTGSTGSTSSSSTGSASSGRGRGSGPGSRDHSLSDCDSLISELVHVLHSDGEPDSSGSSGSPASSTGTSFCDPLSLLGPGPGPGRCNNCDEGLPVAARCTACSEVLCEMCAHAHQRVRITKDHLLIRLDDSGLFVRLGSLSPPQAPLPQSQSMQVPPPPLPLPLVLPLPIPPPRINTRVPPPSRPGVANDNRVRAANMKFLADANNGAQSVKERLEFTRNMLEAVEIKTHKVCTEIRQMSQRFVAAIEERERELLQQVDKVRVLKGKSLVLQMDSLQALLQRFSRLSELLTDTLQHGAPVDMLHAKEKAAVELTQLRSHAARASGGLMLGRGGGGAQGQGRPYEDDALAFLPPEPVLLRAVATMGSLSSSGYALASLAMGEGTTRAVKGRSAAFTVTVKNHLNELAPGQEGLEAVLVGPVGPGGEAGGPVVRADVEDRQDGTYLVMYRPLAEGAHMLNVTLRGRHILGSPFPLTVRAGRNYDKVRQASLTFGSEGGGDGQFLRPWGVCCDRAGRLIVADRSNNRIQVFEQDGTFVMKFGSQGTGPGQFDRPAGVASDSKGRIIVTDKDNHRVQIFSAEGKFLQMFGEMGGKNGQFNYPWDVDVNSAGQIVVSDTRNHRIQLFSPEGQFLNKYGFEGTSTMWKHFDSPRGVTFNKEGYIVVTDFNNHRLVVVEPSLRNARFLGMEGSGIKQFLRPQGVAVDNEGRIVVADSRNNRIQVFESNGTFISQIGPPIEMDRPSGICVTPEGVIAVVDFGNNRIVLL